MTGTTRELTSFLKSLPREVVDRTEEIRRVIDRVWALDREADLRDVFPEV